MHRIATYRLLLLVMPILFTLLPEDGKAQDKNKTEAITKQIHVLFDGMRAGDSTAVRSVLMQECTLYSAMRTPDSTSVLQSGDIESFISAVGTPHEEVWDEKISNLIIHVDDNMATAWMDYRFYRGDKFSHCGTNVMQFFLSNEGWKIIHLMDTRKKKCD